MKTLTVILLSLAMYGYGWFSATEAHPPCNKYEGLLGGAQTADIPGAKARGTANRQKREYNDLIIRQERAKAERMELDLRARNEFGKIPREEWNKKYPFHAEAMKTQ